MKQEDHIVVGGSSLRCAIEMATREHIKDWVGRQRGVYDASLISLMMNNRPQAVIDILQEWIDYCKKEGIDPDYDDM